jgi:hypothetical protein
MRDSLEPSPNSVAGSLYSAATRENAGKIPLFHSAAESDLSIYYTALFITIKAAPP